MYSQNVFSLFFRISSIAMPQALFFFFFSFFLIFLCSCYSKRVLRGLIPLRLR